MMNNPMKYANYKALNFGVDWLTKKFMQLLTPAFWMLEDKDRH